MCADCEMQNPIWGDMSERFLFEDDTLDYYDGPVSGWVRCQSCNSRFAFDCKPIIPDMLWHWALKAPKNKDFQVPMQLTRKMLLGRHG